MALVVPDLQGAPVLVDQDACSLFFEWRTSIMCAEPPPDEIDCEAVDASSGSLYDLSSLSAVDWTAASTDTNNYTLAMCRPLSGVCGRAGSGACLSNSSSTYSLGLAASPRWASGSVNVQYSLVRAVYAYINVFAAAPPCIG